MLTTIGRGIAGELQLASCVMLTSNGKLELFRPLVDDDHTDITVGRPGMRAELSIQVKTALALDRHGRVTARSYFPAGEIREHPRFVYVIIHIVDAAIETGWIVPSPNFNQLANHGSQPRGRVELVFCAYPGREDRWSAYRCRRVDLGPRLLSLLDSLPAGAAPAFPGTPMLVSVQSRRR